MFSFVVSNLVPRAFSSTIFKMADRRENFLPTIRHFENCRGEGPVDEAVVISHLQPLKYVQSMLIKDKDITSYQLLIKQDRGLIN